jgi:hypothetical protein
MSGQNVNTTAVLNNVNSFLSTSQQKMAATSTGTLQATDTVANLSSSINMSELLNPQIQDLLSGPEMQMYQGMDPADQQQYALQMQMEWQTRLETLMTNMLKMHHDTMMSIIGNIRSS